MLVIIFPKTFLFSVISLNLCLNKVSLTVLCYKDLLNFVFFTWICQIKKVCFSPSVFQIPVINVECNFEKKILITWWKQLNQKPACTNELFHRVIKYLLNDDIIGNCVGLKLLIRNNVGQIDFCWYNNSLFNDAFNQAAPNPPYVFSF